MTKLEEIVERAARTAGADIECYWSRGCGPARGCSMCDKRDLALAVARAVIEEAEKAGNELLILEGIVGDHQPSKWRNSAIKMFQAKIRALAAPSEKE